jgi:hypothetical protein
MAKLTGSALRTRPRRKHSPARSGRRVVRLYAPRTSLGDGVVKPVGTRIEWAQLLRRVYLVSAASPHVDARGPLYSPFTGTGDKLQGTADESAT